MVSRVKSTFLAFGILATIMVGCHRNVPMAPITSPMTEIGAVDSSQRNIVIQALSENGIPNTESQSIACRVFVQKSQVVQATSIIKELVDAHKIEFQFTSTSASH